MPVPDHELDPEERRALHATSDPIPTPQVRTILVDVATEQECGFWDAPLWMPIGGLLQGGDDLWEIVSVRLVLPVASPGVTKARPLLYLNARRAEP